MKARLSQVRLSLVGALIGVLYGITARWLFGQNQLELALGIMSVSFLFGVPLVLGFLSVYFGSDKTRTSVVRWIFLPWVSSLATLAVVLALLWEGLICIVLWLPIMLGFASIGGIAGGFLARSDRSTFANGLIIVCAVLFPFALSPLEYRIASPTDVRTVQTEITIHSDPATIWDHIKEVPRIRTDELPSSWAQRIGFPRPVEATLAGVGVGAVRHATFEGGVLFIETIAIWDPPHTLSFTIRAQTYRIPAITLDEHVTVGGPYFDVLDGTYRIEPAGADNCILHLSSTHRLSTRFNAYARIWTDWLMQDIQTTILQVIKQRCEAPSVRVGAR